MKKVVSFLILGCLIHCAWIYKNDPVLPVNQYTYQQCPGVPYPGCRTDDEECPLEGHECIYLPPSTCEMPPCEGSITTKRKILDAGNHD